MGDKAQIKNLKIGHLNARSLFTGFHELVNLIEENDFHVMCISETWLNENIPNNVIDIPNYSLFRKDRLSRGGGVGIYIRHNLKVTQILSDFGSIEGIEHLWIKIKVDKIYFLIGVIYRSPSNNVNLFIEFLDNIISHTTPQFENIIILGDLNVDHCYDNLVNQCMISYDFQQLITEHTRVTNASHSIIDVIYTNCRNLLLNSGTLDSYDISDHQAIFCELKCSIPVQEPFFVTYRDFKNFIFNDFNEDLCAIPWDNILYINDIDDKLNLLNNYILTLFDKHAPLKTSRISKPYAPWITTSIKDMMKTRNKALQKYKRTKDPNDHNFYKELRNLVISALRREKAAYLSHQLKNPNNKELWKSIRILNIKQKSLTEIPQQLKNVNDINNYFLSVFSPVNNCPNTTNYYATNKFNNNISFSFRLATVEDIKTIILDLKSNAYGIDQICARMLQYCSPVICPYITHIINCCLLSGYFPDIWKSSVIRPLPKINNPSTFNELRPISILPALSKVLEKFLNIQMFDYVINNNIVSDKQSGFRKGYSTTSLLLNVTDHIIRSLDIGLATALVLLDFSKAFDTLDHCLLCAKLNYFGFDDRSVQFFNSYLSNRRQRVVIDELSSDSGYVTSGVPQGSILGPLLFLIYTSDIFNVVKFSNIQAFADDTQIYYSFDPTNVILAGEYINKDLCALHDYSVRHNLKLNGTKCNALIFCNKPSETLISNNLKLVIQNQTLNIIKSGKNLGIIFDSKLKFQEYVSLIVKRSYIALKLLYCNASILNFKVRKKLTETLVLSILNYGITLYFPCLDNITQHRLQKIQNCCCRFVFGLRKFDRVSSKINELGWLKIGNLYKYHMSVFVYRILSTSSPSYLREKLIFRYNVHCVNIRNSNELTIPRFHLTMFKRSFTYNSAEVYNNINSNLKSLSLNSFRVKIKNMYLTQQ